MHGMQEHPGHSMYRTRHMPDYLLMCEIFGDSIANGREEFVTNDVPPSPPSIHADALGDNDMGADDDGTPQNEEARDEHISSIKGRSAASGGSSRQITRRQSTGDAMVAVVGRMADAVDAISRNTTLTKNLQKEA